jgi:hypothetical protein
MNYKALLNQYCQKHQIALTYDTRRNGGQDHIPSFTSKVKMQEYAFISDPAPSKKDAEQFVAEVVYKFLVPAVSPSTCTSGTCSPEACTSVTCPSTRSTCTLSPPNPDEVTTVWMIDGENLPNLYKQIEHDRTRQVIVYLSRGHPLVQKDLPSYMIKRVSNSTRPDGCDILLTMEVSQIPTKYPNVETINIYTKDRFASAIVDNASDILGDKIKVLHLLGSVDL